MWTMRTLTAAMLLAAPTAAAGQPIELEPEQAISLQVGEADGPIIVGIGRAEWTPSDVAAARHLSGQTPPEAPLATADPFPEGVVPQPASPAADVVQLRFMAVAGRHALLVVENGYDLALVYRARMMRDGATRHTDVCAVPPGDFGYEYWPHPIERLDLSDFRLVRWRDGQQVTCE